MVDTGMMEGRDAEADDEDHCWALAASVLDLDKISNCLNPMERDGHKDEPQEIQNQEVVQEPPEGVWDDVEVVMR